MLAHGHIVYEIPLVAEQCIALIFPGTQGQPLQLLFQRGKAAVGIVLFAAGQQPVCHPLKNIPESLFHLSLVPANGFCRTGHVKVYQNADSGTGQQQKQLIAQPEQVDGTFRIQVQHQHGVHHQSFLQAKPLAEGRKQKKEQPEGGQMIPQKGKAAKGQKHGGKKSGKAPGHQCKGLLAGGLNA